MNPSLPVPNTLVFDLAAGRCSDWLAQARALWAGRPFFLLALSALVVFLRWTLDGLGEDVLIVVSYLTDAWIFTWLVLGVSRAPGGSAWAIARAGWQGLRGRFFAVLKTVLWGIPSAMTSYFIFLLVPEGVQALVVLQGNVLVATGVLFVALVVGGFLSMLLCLLPVLAAMQMARDSQATLLSSGLWAYRGIRAGIRPLAVLFVVFVSSVAVCNAAVTLALGHLPLELFEGWSSGDILGVLSQSPLTVFFAMNAFLALLPGVAGDLLRSADTDLSDEIFSDADKVTHGDAFGVRVLERASQALRMAAMLFVVFLVIYAALSGYDEAAHWLVFAVLAYVCGGSFRKSAKAWRERQSWSLRYRFVITPLLLLGVLIAIGQLPDPPEEPAQDAAQEAKP
ncbi:MAG: hypothetical protein RI884_1996 [Pseudomonadota bacterium]